MMFLVEIPSNKLIKKRRAVKLFIYLLMMLSITASSQEPVWDDLVQQEDLNLEDDALILQAESLRRNPVNLNTADATELQQLPYINEWQKQQFLAYRSLMGNLLHVYELQAVPGWTPDLIRLLQPFMTVEENWLQRARREKWFKDGVHSLLLRYSTKTDGGAEDDPPPSNFKMLFRYRYAYRDRLQYGVVADKDAGEPFLGPVQRAGFDFYSFHFFIRKKGLLQVLALGDFTINMGQGLIHWQRMSFGKGAETALIKQQAAVINPYQSAGEYLFHRGLALGVSRGRWQAHFFVSQRRLSATVERDSLGNTLSFSTIRTSGLHVTSSEQAGKNQLGQLAAGAVLRYHLNHFQVSFNAICHKFSIPARKPPRPDNLFSMKGRYWWNGSIDYGYTWRNLHVFGELASDRRRSVASLQGLLVSLSSGLDIALVRRDLAIAYQSVAGQAFTESTTPGNERGTFVSVDWRPSPAVRIQAFADQYLFPWIRYNYKRPHRGTDFQWQLTHKLNKRSLYTIRWRQSAGQDDDPGETNDGSSIVRNLRFHQQVGMNGKLEWRQRLEWKQVLTPLRPRLNGCLYYTEFLFKPPLRKWNLGMRLLWFETDGYAARLYAYERDVLYFSSLPAFYDRGYRVYFLARYEPLPHLGVWCKWAATWKRSGHQAGPQTSGTPRSGPVSEIRLQILVQM